MRNKAVIIGLLSFVSISAQEGNYDWNQISSSYSGIQYTSTTVSEPRPIEIHCLRIDSHNKWVRFTTTGRADAYVENLSETVRKTTRNFMRESRENGRDVVVAINGDGFQPWPVPVTTETLTDLTGLAVSDGVLVSPPTGEPSFVVFDDHTMTVTPGLPNLDGVRTAVSGFSFVLVDGVTVPAGNDLHPRTGIGVSEDGRFAYFLIVDGRRAGFSEGATTEEVGAWLKHFGAHNGLNMDGGGSSTMAAYDSDAGGDGVILLSHPNGTDCSGNCGTTERANGNNTGVYLAADEDHDQLPDDYETNTGVYASDSDTGTDPNDADSDDDGVRDGTEVALGTDPNDELDTPALRLSPWSWALLAFLLSLAGVAANRRFSGQPAIRH